MILSFLSQKGGVGKSTLARLVAVEAARGGWQAMIVDLDAAQGTAHKWQQRRRDAWIKPDVAVTVHRTAARALAQPIACDLAIYDGPAQAERSAPALARASDLVVLPASYSFDDLEPQVRVAHELERAGVAPARIRIALTRVRGSAVEGGDVRAYIREAGLAAFAAELRDLPSIRLAHMAGRAASEVPHPRVADEARALAHEIATTLTEASHA